MKYYPNNHSLETKSFPFYQPVYKVSWIRIPHTLERIFWLTPNLDKNGKKIKRKKNSINHRLRQSWYSWTTVQWPGATWFESRSSYKFATVSSTYIYYVKHNKTTHYNHRWFIYHHVNVFKSLHSLSRICFLLCCSVCAFSHQPSLSWSQNNFVSLQCVWNPSSLACKLLNMWFVSKRVNLCQHGVVQFNHMTWCCVI